MGIRFFFLLLISLQVVNPKLIYSEEAPPTPVSPAEPDEPEASPDDAEVEDDAEDSQYEKDWNATNISFNLLIEELNNFTCYEDTRKFLGCIAVVNASLAMSESKNQIGTSDALKLMVGYSEKNEIEFGELKIGILTPPENKDFSADLAAAMSEFKAKRKLVIEKMSEAYKSMPVGKRPSFTEIFEWLRKNKLEKKLLKSERETAGQLMNIFYATALDPHTAIWPNATVNRLNNGKEVDTSFYGIGAVVTKVKDITIFSAIMEGSPALKAGLKPNDEIISVDGFRISKLNVQQIVKKIRGPLDTVVRLRVKRGEEKLVILVTRGLIKGEANVTAKVRSKENPEFISVRLREFSGSACEGVADAVNKTYDQMQKDKQIAKGIILDLRSNPGGLLDQAACIVGLFVGPGLEVITSRDMDGKIKSTLKTRDFDLEIPKLPLTILINAGSASASEIVSGALQHYGFLVLGDRSFGKASIQGSDAYFNFINRSWGVTMMRTIRRYFLPSGITPQNQGVTPDIFVYPKPDMKAEDVFSVREEDRYENALPLIGEKWTQKRPEKIAAIEKCIKETGHASETWKKFESEQIPEDYQLLYAEDALRCLSSN